jgi:hypothetical protein
MVTVVAGTSVAAIVRIMETSLLELKGKQQMRLAVYVEEETSIMNKQMLPQ